MCAPVTYGNYILGLGISAFGISDGIFITTQCYILLSCVDKERATASFCTLNVLYSFSVATGGPIAGKIVPL